MGNKSTKDKKEAVSDASHPVAKVEESKHKNLDDINFDLTFAIDFTASNQISGRKTFKGKCLHDITGDEPNFYERIIRDVGTQLKTCDNGKFRNFYAYGFGDEQSKDHSVFSLRTGKTVDSALTDSNYADIIYFYLNDLQETYRCIIPHIVKMGPTSIVPAINTAIDIVKKNERYHVLIIIVDGGIQNLDESIVAITNASSTYPLSIFIIGVGDGPWDDMEILDQNVRNKSASTNFMFFNLNDYLECNSKILCDRLFHQIRIQYAGILWRNAYMEAKKDVDYLSRLESRVSQNNVEQPNINNNVVNTPSVLQPHFGSDDESDSDGESHSDDDYRPGGNAYVEAKKDFDYLSQLETRVSQNNVEQLEAESLSPLPSAPGGPKPPDLISPTIKSSADNNKDKNDEQYNEKTDCVVCMEKIDKKVALVPCGHAKLCRQCISKLVDRECPLCKKSFISTMDIYD